MLTIPISAHADLHEPFETAEPSWTVAEADCTVQVGTHHRTFLQQRNGQGSEYLRLRAGAGTRIYLTHEMPPARIIDELSPTVWIKSDRPGLRLMLRVVLPRSADDQGNALKTLLRGDSYTDVGNWQQLRVPELRKLLDREVAMLRTQFGSQVTAREAYADLVVFNAYGGTGDTQLWIDDLRVSGIAKVDPRQIAANERQSLQNAVAKSELPFVPALPIQGQTPVDFEGDRLLVDGRPRFIRAIEHRGERLDYLQGLGFNAVRLAQPATAEQLASARELGLWLIAPPPLGVGERELQHDNVIVWDVGDAVAARDLESVRQLASRVRRADPMRRPTLTIPRDSAWQFSRVSNIVALRPAGQSLVGGELELADYHRYLTEQRRALSPGIASWAVLPTQLPAAVIDQWKAIDSSATLHDCIEPQQLHLLAYQSLAAGVRGILFTSRSPLDQADASSGLRANLLQCLNQQLGLLEPWVAGGDLSDEFEINDPSISVALLKTERSTLALLTKVGPSAQYVAAPQTPRPASLVIRGVPPSSHAFSVTPIGLHTLRVERQGGMRLDLERFRHSAVVMISHDPLVMNHLSQAINAQRSAAARARRELVSRQLALTREVLDQAEPQAGEPNRAIAQLEQAESLLRRGEMLLDAGDDRNAVGAAAESLEFLAAARHDVWKSAIRGFPSPTASPLCVSFASLPLHWQLSKQLQSATWGRNRLPAGDMENLDFMQQAGWEQYQSTTAGIDTLVELTPQASRTGAFSLRMEVAGNGSPIGTSAFDRPPIEIRSPPVPVDAGQLLQIRGWAKITTGPMALATANVNGWTPLVVYDSIGGPQLGQTIKADGTWREFVLYRMAPAEGAISLTLALRGYGEARVDDVVIIPLESR